MPPRPKLPRAVAYRGQRENMGKEAIGGEGVWRGPDNLNAHPPGTHSNLPTLSTIRYSAVV